MMTALSFRKFVCVALLALVVSVKDSNAFVTSSSSNAGIVHHLQQQQRSPTPPNSLLIVGGSPTKTNTKKTTTTTSLYSSSVDRSDDDVTIIDPDFRCAGIFLGLGVLLDLIPGLQLVLGPLATLLGILFLVQTFRLKFVCDATTFSLENTSQESGQNVIVGGENKWTYDSFVNYDFFPEGWIDQPQGPILVYFKENQTPSDKWNEGPGAKANSEEAIANGAIPGQVHFFPAICDCKQLAAEWAKRGCQKL